MRPLLLALALLALPALAENTPRHGLLWHRTGLPLTFPLVVQTAPGRSYHLLLRNAETGAPALAAFITGGRYFRVLAPPGRYEVEIHHGQGWIDEDQLFGPGTGQITLDAPLTFQIKGLGTKAGHVLDLRQFFSEEA